MELLRTGYGRNRSACRRLVHHNRHGDRQSRAHRCTDILLQGRPHGACRYVQQHQPDRRNNSAHGDISRNLRFDNRFAERRARHKLRTVCSVPEGHNNGTSERRHIDEVRDNVSVEYWQVFITASDNNGNGTALNTTSGYASGRFYIDTKAPDASDITVGTAGDGKDFTSGTTYIRTGAFALSGTCSDANFDSAVLAVSKDGGTATKVEFTTSPTASSSAWSYFQAATDGLYVYTLTVKDKANRTTTKTVTVRIDTADPSTAWDSTAPFTYSVLAGGKYWSKNSVSTIKIAASDTGSGLSDVQYAYIHRDTDTSAPIDTDWTTAWTSAACLSSSSGSYTAKVTLQEGVNYIRVRAKDNAGHTTENNDTKIICCDMLAPAVSSVKDGTGNDAAVLSSVLSNGSKDITAYITPDDTNGTIQVSGTTAVKVLVGSRNFAGTGTIAATETSAGSGIWAVTIPAASIASAFGSATSGTKTVYVQLTDLATNASTAVTLFSIQLDKNPPAVSFSTQSGTVNKTISISGTASDIEGLSTSAISYLSAGSYTYGGTAYTASSATDPVWTAIDKTDASTIYSWTTKDFDTTAYYTGTGSKSMLVKATATDKAGNTSEAYLPLTVDQDSDRPVLTLSNLSLAGMTSANKVWLKSTKTFYGSVSDDDGTVTSISVRYKYNGSDTWTDAAGAAGTLVLNNTSWSLAVPKDGPYIFEFTVTDAKGSVFTSSASPADAAALLKTPKIKDSDATPHTFGYTLAAGDSLAYARVDTVDPTGAIEGVSSDSKGLADAGKTWTTGSYTSLLYGGTIKKFGIKVTAEDANGIASVKATTTGLTRSEEHTSELQSP